jgi:hypothetical protein
MKKTKVLYWIFTILFAAFMLLSAIPDILVMQLAVDGFAQIGLTAHLVPFLGWAKLLGVIAILVPGFPRIREWAYAGLMFDLIGAIYLVMFIKPASEWMPIFLPVLLGILSYHFYHKRLKERA